MSVTIQTCMRRAQELKNSDSARLDVELLLAHIFDKDRSYLYTWPEKCLTEDQQEQFESLLGERLKGKPIAHLLGYREFWGLSFEVDASTLIPRPDTETLVEAALSLSLPIEAKVIDLGTGTGAIAMALASEKPSWHLLAVDQSLDAVNLAQRNQQRLQLSNVIVQRSDWFNDIEDSGYHLIVSNPPYIDKNDPHLAQGDVRFEPLTALVAEDEGLADIRHILHQGRQYLLPHGWLMLEHGYRQGAAVFQLFEEFGYQQVKTLQDFGYNDRVTLGQFVS